MRLGWKRRLTPNDVVTAGDSTAPPVELSDAPLVDPTADQLGRKSFAKRLAATLAERNDRSSIVVGLYGPWGDGKSTILSFVENFLQDYQLENQAVKVVKFNPWLYADELQVFEEFLHAIASLVGKNLLSKRERAGKQISKVGRLTQSASFGSSAVTAGGSLVGAVGELLGRPTLLNLRDRLQEIFENEAFVSNPMRIVVLMDDIDRLDSSQITTVFRMIKLAADFPFISYLVAFDHKVVSQALGARYLQGDAKAGEAFLEKIVQVPMHLPRADPSLVAKLMNESLQAILKRHETQLHLDETNRLQRSLDLWVWPHIATLRTGKRLLNIIDFAVPIMRGEVNPVDQVLLEAVRILFPDAYSYAARSKSALLTVQTDQGRRTQIKSDIEKALDETPTVPNSSGRQLLQALFPHLESIYSNHYYNDEQAFEWVQQKRICSPSHFARYFAYGLPIGDILDRDIQQVIETGEPDNKSLLERLIQQNDAGLVIQKLIEHTSSLSVETSARLAYAIAELGAQLPAPTGLAHPESPTARAGYLTTLVLRNIPLLTRESIASGTLSRSNPSFAALAFSWMEAASEPDQGEPLLAPDALRRLGTALTLRYVDMRARDLFQVHRLNMTPLIIGICARYGESEEITNSLFFALNADLDLLRGLLSMYLMATVIPAVNALNRTGYERLSALIPPHRLVSLITDHFPSYQDKAHALAYAAPTSTEVRQMVTSPDAPVLTFLALHATIDTIRPTPPSTVFDPSTQRPAQLMNRERGTLPQAENAQLSLAIRAAAIRPAHANPNISPEGIFATQHEGRARQDLLAEIIKDAHLGSSLGITSRNSSSGMADWQFAGTNAGEVSNVYLKGDAFDEYKSASAHLSLTTGWSRQTDDQVATGSILGWIDVTVQVDESSRLTITKLQEVLIDLLGVINITYKAASKLLPPRPYETGEASLWIGTNADGLHSVIDMDDFPVVPRNAPRTEVMLYTTLPLGGELDNSFRGISDDAVSPIAVEFITRILEWSSRRGYEPTMHQLRRRIATA